MTDYDRFIARVRTFRATTWCGHNEDVSPLVCARFGWKNVEFDVLQCDDCKTVLPFIERCPEDDDDPRTDVEYYTDLLQSSHCVDCPWRSRSCPVEYLRIQIQPLEKTMKEFLTRFDVFDKLWDVPVFRSPVLQEQENLELLSEFLERRQKLKFENSVGVNLEDLKNRTRIQMILALFGWELHWNLNFVFLPEGNEISIRPKFSLGFENNPEHTGLCFGRQSYLICGFCNAKIGLWSCKTTSSIKINPFQTLMKQKKSLKEAPKTGLKRSRDESILQKQEKSKYSFLDKRPIFGMKKFAKTVFLENDEVPVSVLKTGSTAQEQEQDFSMCHPVHTESLFDPLQHHRPFCPYLKDWKRLLTAITEGYPSADMSNSQSCDF